MATRVTVKHAENAVRARLSHHRPRVIFRIARVDNHRHTKLRCQRELIRKSSPLLAPRRIVVVVIETTLAERHSTLCDEVPQSGDITCPEPLGVVRMDAGREPHEAGVRGCNCGRCTSGAEDIPGAASGTDAHNGFGPAIPCAIDYLAAVAVERRVGEVRVAVDEPFDIPSFRGHFLSIQRSTGAAM